ncbi:hypothetical protein WA026_023082 [Henosepilachna vigintioctopunctata]|uniref:Uncharacterized protein n=1 Tax=Henosepilachna vigintioctopunctata TaxID=420089 RepID=A0AAW1UD56_9CUCU
MENEDFFGFIESRLKVTISEIIKAHLKFHNMDNFTVASTLYDRDIRKIEEFAQNTLHQILRPEEMLQFYGTHFEENPRLFVFSLLERMVISDIKRVCQEICGRNRQYTEDYDLDNNECDITTSDYLRDTPKCCDNCKEWINMQVNFKKEEAVIDTFKNARNTTDAVSINQDKDSRTVLYTNDITHFCPDSTEQRGVSKFFGPIRKLFLAKNKMTKRFKR